MKIKLILILVILPLIIYSQNGITFKIEDLEKPDDILFLATYDNILQRLIIIDNKVDDYDIKKNNIDIKYNIIAQSKAPDRMVSFGMHSFFNGMYQAYADHRPFVLSPDMIWLLISQGFAQHVNNNSEELRKYFVNYTGKLTLVVRNDSIQLDNPDSPWEKVFPEFTKQISTYAGVELMNDLTCNFTTTTPVSKIASEITIMKAMKPYFDFIVMRMVCGIPEITLEGTTEDWQKVLEKAQYLKKYKLDWWIGEIEPLLKEFVKASKGNIDKDFWRNMFKYHSLKEYGAPKVINGWIVKFFPYDKDGKRNKLKEIDKTDMLPDEMVKVDLEYLNVSNDTTVKTPLELWAGFVGLEQNKETYALKPHIAWMIRKKDKDNEALKKKIKSDGSTDEFGGGIIIRVKTVPKEILEMSEIKKLDIQFIDEINIPEEMSKIKIDNFRMTGKVTNKEIERICKLLPNTELLINNKAYNIRNNGHYFLH